MLDVDEETKSMDGMISSFRLQVQPDKASCFVTSIAMVIDKPVAEVIAAVDKPYKDIIHPGREGSMKYRGHHPQDFTEYLQGIGWAMVINYAKWPAHHLYSGKTCMLCGGKGKFRGRWEEGNLLVKGNTGILQYDHHFCAWIDNKVYNPNGKIQDFYTTGLIGFHPLYQISRTQNVSDRRSGEGQTS